MKRRIMPLLEIKANAYTCDPRCVYLDGGPRIPRCKLFTGTLDEDGKHVLRADECKTAEANAKQVVIP